MFISISNTKCFPHQHEDTFIDVDQLNVIDLATHNQLIMQ